VSATERIAAKLSQLTPRQIAHLEALADSFITGTSWWANPKSDFANDGFATEFGDLLLRHHNLSAEPISKDRFEYALIDVLNSLGHTAKKLPNGNPGEDMTVDNQRWSLKTQQNKDIKEAKIWISKFMELGKGAWTTVADVEALRERMFQHMTHYDRIFILRCFRPHADQFDYELVEIPKSLLLSSKQFPISIMENSRQNPKPARCEVSDADGLAFSLYFDGGTERKLQIQHLAKRNCLTHAKWNITVSA